jgi:hypothetical protein
MHPLFTQDLARQHQAALAREAINERMSSHAYKQVERSSVLPGAFQQRPLSESDFAAIKRDLRLMLSEWCLEAGKANNEAVIETFMRRLRARLGYGVDKKEKVHSERFYGKIQQQEYS